MTTLEKDPFEFLLVLKRFQHKFNKKHSVGIYLLMEVIGLPTPCVVLVNGRILSLARNLLKEKL
ncbi:MAG: hypothetical protein Ct9H300mP6_18660 [Gammaproteobacteria bacterium]|nr:MAG: hypothetical protein Ct9H300mP6_18660 [Gammaproteobacteria bacterium]